MTRFASVEFRKNFSPRQKRLYKTPHGPNQPWILKLTVTWQARRSRRMIMKVLRAKERTILRFNVTTLLNLPLLGQSVWKRDISMGTNL